MSLQATKMRKQDEEANERIKALAQTAGAEQQGGDDVVIPDVPAAGEQAAGSDPLPENNDAGSEPPDNTANEVARLKAEVESANNRWRSLQGIIDKANTDNEALRTLLAQLTQQLQQGARPETPEAPRSAVSEKDEEAFGKDMIDLIRRVSKETAVGEMVSLDTRMDDVSQRVSKVGEVVAKSAAERFNDALAREVSDWEQVNLDPNFVQWLTPYGVQALNAAYSAMDLQATAKVFRDYKQLTGAAPAAEPPAAKPSDKLETLVSPGKSRSAPVSPNANQGKTWTPSDITKLYEDNRRGKITKEQFTALESDLFKAQREGRFAR